MDFKMMLVNEKLILELVNFKLMPKAMFPKCLYGITSSDYAVNILGESDGTK